MNEVGMNRKSGSGSGIFLMEMIVAVFFFMLCASTCILAFAKSDRMSRLAADRDQAVSAAQSVAEIWKLEGMEGLTERMNACKLPAGATTGGDNAIQENSYRICWDKNWQCVDAWPEDGAQGTDSAGIARPDFKYMAVLRETEDGDGMKKLRIHIQDGERDAPALFELEVSRYARAAGG